MKWFTNQRRSASATRGSDPEPLLIKIGPLKSQDDDKDGEKDLAPTSMKNSKLAKSVNENPGNVDKEAKKQPHQQYPLRGIPNGHVPGKFFNFGLGGGG